MILGPSSVAVCKVKRQSSVLWRGGTTGLGYGGQESLGTPEENRDSEKSESNGESQRGSVEVIGETATSCLKERPKNSEGDSSSTLDATKSTERPVGSAAEESDSNSESSFEVEERTQPLASTSGRPARRRRNEQAKAQFSTLLAH
ncbi:hypothetical protein NE237_002455 [Protea cynaroides]|uniref:Uncharacterized protein n=1 Tax=Protea cynaroides TaxID=273540 RepID=A0A9Q0KW63_9MAGN|nr:hypothetical protein NE237_002455 [Protea cynaroides]